MGVTRWVLRVAWCALRGEEDEEDEIGCVLRGVEEDD